MGQAPCRTGWAGGNALRFAYADPPYPGTARSYPERTEVDHGELIQRLERDYDGWLLHSNSQSIAPLVNLVPRGTRILAWGKYHGLPVTSAGLIYTWEPIFLKPVRQPSDYVRDSLWFDMADQLKWMRGQKPIPVVTWLFRAAGLQYDDELSDLFPGTGAVGRAWDEYSRQLSLRYDVGLAMLGTETVLPGALTQLKQQAPRRPEYACDHCGHPASDHAQRWTDSDLAPCHHALSGRLKPGQSVRSFASSNATCGCEDFQSEAADNDFA